MQFAEYLGLAAGALVTCSMVPQIIRIFKLRSARDISLLFTTLIMLGMVCWLIYGIVLNLIPVILWNAVGIALLSVLLYGKLRYGK